MRIRKKKTGWKTVVCLLSAAMLAAMMPAGALAEENNSSVADSGSEETSGGSEQPADTAENSENNGATEEGAGQAESLVDGTDQQPDQQPQPGSGASAGTDGTEENEGTEEPEGEEGSESPDEPGGSDGTDGSEGELPEMPDLVFPVVLPLTEGTEYEQLSTFLGLSADRFAIYTLVFVDAGQQPVQPDEAVEVSLDIPADYDMSRVVVSEVSIEGETPQRTELDFEAKDGKAVFSTDHMGIYVVMEKTVYPSLPGSLEPTEKIDRLELSKTIPSALAAASSVAGAGSVSALSVSAPLTGDNGVSPAVWIGIMIAAVAAVVVVIIIKKKK